MKPNHWTPPPSFNEDDPFGDDPKTFRTPPAEPHLGRTDFLAWITGGLIGWFALLGVYTFIDAALAWVFP